jgi:hypothetical protein
VPTHNSSSTHNVVKSANPAKGVVTPVPSPSSFCFWATHRTTSESPPANRVALTPGGCQFGHTCDQNSTYGLHSLPGGVSLVTRATRTRLMGCTHSRGVSAWLHVRPELDLWVALTPGGCQMGYTCDQNSTYGLHSLPGGVSLVTSDQHITSVTQAVRLLFCDCKITT